MIEHHTIHVRPQAAPSISYHTDGATDHHNQRNGRCPRSAARDSLRASQYNAKPAGANFWGNVITLVTHMRQ